MKIKLLNIYLFKRQLKTGMHISRGGFTERFHCIVEVITECGIRGLGEGIGNAALVKSILADYLAHKVLGMDPCNIELMRKTLLDNDVYFERKGATVCAASAIEMACWDIKGKALGRPVYDLLGGKLHTLLPAYASDIYWQESATAMSDYAKGLLDSGFQAVKAHIGFCSPREELTRLEAIRTAIGDSTSLMIDINAGYNVLQAKQAFHLWQDVEPLWIEEPLHPDNEVSLKQLSLSSHIPIACGENEMRLAGFKRLLELGAVDVCMPDIGRVGGILETKEISALCRAYGVPVSLHNFSSGILFAATVHVMASTSNQTLLEMDNSNNAVYQELLEFDLQLTDGCLKVPDVIGLGVTLPQEVIEKDVQAFIRVE